MGKKFDGCPKCEKKGVYVVQGYDPSPEMGILYLCRYCTYTKRVERTKGSEIWFSVIWVEKETGRRLAICKPHTEKRAIQEAQRWSKNTKAERIEVARYPDNEVIWRSDEVHETS